MLIKQRLAFIILLAGIPMALIRRCALQTSQLTKQIVRKLISVPVVACAIEMQSASKETALPLAHARVGSLAMALHAVISMNAEMLRCVVSATFVPLYISYIIDSNVPQGGGGALSTCIYGEVSPIFLGHNIAKGDIFGSK